MKRKKRILIVCMMIISLFTGVTVYAAPSKNMPKSEINVFLQAEGKAAILPVRVEFSDVGFSDGKTDKIHTQEEFLQICAGEEDKNSQVYPHESLAAYYKRSSYGRLEIYVPDDQVYDVKLPNTKAYYGNDYGGEYLSTILQILDDQGVDFSNYDADNDGIVDMICFNFAGDNTGYSTLFWDGGETQKTSLRFDEKSIGAWVQLETHRTQTDAEGRETATAERLIHEVGHLFGLDDYYNNGGEYGGINTNDMMSNNIGEHDGFSKWLTDWISNDQIEKVDAGVGEEGVDLTLSPLTISNPIGKKLIAVVAPEFSSDEDTFMYDEYFMIQYDNEAVNNNEVLGYGVDKAFRIYHVGANLNDAGRFIYGNAPGGETALIRAEKASAFTELFTEGCTFSPDSEPNNSSFFAGNVDGYTGITITNFTFNDDGTATCHISFAKEKKDTLKLTIDSDAQNMNDLGELIFKSNIAISVMDGAQAYLEKDGVHFPLSMKMADDTTLTTSYTPFQQWLSPNTEYTLVIPQGTLRITAEKSNQELRYTVKTADFPEVEYGTASSDSEYDSAPVSLTEQTTAQFLCKKIQDDTFILEMRVNDAEGKAATKTIEIPAKGAQPYYSYDIACVSLGDQTVALNLYNDFDGSRIYKIDADGNLVGTPQIFSDKVVAMSAFGDNVKAVKALDFSDPYAIIGSTSDLTVYTMDFENDLKQTVLRDGLQLSWILPVNDSLYATTAVEFGQKKVELRNAADEVVRSCEIGYNTPVSVQTDGTTDYILLKNIEDNDKYSLICKKYQNGTLVESQTVVGNLETWPKESFGSLNGTAWGWILQMVNTKGTTSWYLFDTAMGLIGELRVPAYYTAAAAVGNKVQISYYSLNDEKRVFWTAKVTDESEPTPIETPEPTSTGTPEPTPALTGENVLLEGNGAQYVKSDGGTQKFRSNGEFEKFSHQPINDTVVAKDTGDSNNIGGYVIVIIVATLIVALAVAGYLITRKENKKDF